MEAARTQAPNATDRTPGICSETSQHLNGRWLYGFRIIPDRGTWLEVQFDTNDLLYVYLDRRRRRHVDQQVVDRAAVAPARRGGIARDAHRDGLTGRIRRGGFSGKSTPGIPDRPPRAFARIRCIPGGFRHTPVTNPWFTPARPKLDGTGRRR